jgi:hypothetical protein
MLSCGVGNAGEISSGVVNFTFLRAQHSFKYVEIHILEGAGLPSSPRLLRGQDCSERNAWSLISALTGGGAPSNAVTRIISWHEIAAEQPEARKAGG